jgi:dynein heavy chain
MFGGHHDAKTRLNDTWFFNVKELEWSRVGGEKDNVANAASTIGAPAPRANSSACIYNNKVYLYGGHGGLGYTRSSFNDLYSFDLETEQWEKIIPQNNCPEGRGGHSVFASDDKIYIYGGWNQEMQFNSIWIFNL